MAHTSNDEKKRIRLGSGDIYMTEFNGTIPDDTVIETEDNMLGYVQGGATIEYKPTAYTAKSDDGKVSRTFITDEELSFKLGVITWNAKTLNMMVATGEIIEKDGKRILMLGGLENQNNKKYLFRFVHRDKIDGDVRVTVVGSNQAGFSLGWVRDKETSINPEIKGEPLDEAGHILIFEEEMLGLQPLAIKLRAGTTGKTKVADVDPISSMLKYKIGSEAAVVNYDDVCSSGWSTLSVGTTEIAATAGNVITVVAVDSASNKAKRYGTVTVMDDIG